MTHPFATALERLRQERGEERDEFWETKRVEFVLRQTKLLAGCRKERMVPQNFAEFAEMFPSFPFLIKTDRMNGVKLHESVLATVPALHRKFLKAPFMAAFEEWFDIAETKAISREIGLLVPRSGLRQGWLITCCLPGEIPQRHDYQGLTVMWQNKELAFYLRDFENIVIGLATNGWRP